MVIGKRCSIQMMARIATLTAAIVMVSCDEQLPEYHPPEGILQASIVHAGDDSILYISGDSNNPDKAGASFPQSTSFELRVVNTFDETLQEIVDLSGTVEIAIPLLPQFRQTIPVTATALNSSHIDEDGILTINPGDTILLKVYWNYKMNDTTWAFTKAHTESDSKVFNEGPRIFYFWRYHERLTFTVKGTVKMFKTVAPVTTGTQEFYIKFTGKIYCCS